MTDFPAVRLSSATSSAAPLPVLAGPDMQMQLLTRWNAAVDARLEAIDFHWTQYDQFPHPTFKGGSPEAYSEFGDVLLEFYELGDNFTYLSDNDLFTTPLIYLFDSGGVGFDVDFKGLTADFAQSGGGTIFASATRATRQGLATFLARIP